MLKKFKYKANLPHLLCGQCGNRDGLIQNKNFGDHIYYCQNCDGVLMCAACMERTDEKDIVDHMERKCFKNVRFKSY